MDIALKTMTTKFLYDFILRHKLAVIATVSDNNKSESALMGITVTKDLKIIFDTSSKSRKYLNLMSNPSISLVIGWDNEQTLQYEGIAKFPKNEELKKLKEIYFKTFPDGKEREKWVNITYVCVEPRWLRFSDYNEPMKIEERNFNQ